MQMILISFMTAFPCMSAPLQACFSPIAKTQKWFIGRKKNLQLNFEFFTEPVKMYFFQAIIHFTIFTGKIFGIWSKFGSK